MKNPSVSDHAPGLISHHGHRARLKQRYDEVGLDGMAKHEAVELLLTYVIPQKDVKPLAKRLLERFHDLPELFAARRESLLEVEGIGEQAARFLHVIRDLGQQALKARAMHWGAALACPKDVVEYLRALMANLPEEEFVTIFVDHANRVIRYETLSRGVEDQTAVYPRKVMKRALALHATGIAVAHNHPTGNPQPSPADREITRHLAAAASTLELRLLDHIIIGRDQQAYFSFRENGLLP
ncbi:MAG TPA: DNA repair protein RadC [Candidatus Ozemobacteraceae bacterium]|nr:DNA repair protein RadC [Candidatus Ozemobacteraceae bacterium]